MLDKPKVELMTKLAFYEHTHGKEDFKINEYYRKDYTGFHTLCSIIWLTIGYIGIIGLVVCSGLDWILEDLSKSKIIAMGIVAIAGYLLIVIIYTLIASRVYDKRHKEARQRMKDFNYNLTKLLKIYEKEKR